MYELLFILKSRYAYLPVFITYIACFVLGLLQMTMKWTLVQTVPTRMTQTMESLASL